MGKSYKKTPIAGFGGGSEKNDKVIAHRKLRHKAKVMLSQNPEDYMEPKIEEVSDEWDMAKDGKGYFGDIEDKKYVEELMRK